MTTAAKIRKQMDDVASQPRIDGARRFFKEPVDPRGVAAGEVPRAVDSGELVGVAADEERIGCRRIRGEHDES